jgi:O-methyltransferase
MCSASRAIDIPSDELDRKAAVAPITVLVADDAQLIRRAIRRLLEKRSEIEVIGEASDYAQTVWLANDLRPQIIVMDLHLACRDGITPQDVKANLNHGSRLVVVSVANDEEAKAQAESFGAFRLLDKMNLFDELIPTILQEDLTPLHFERSDTKFPNVYRSCESIGQISSRGEVARTATGPLGRPKLRGRWIPTKNKLKSYLLRLFYGLAHKLAAPAVYSRQPFARYPYMFLPSQIMELTRQLLSVKVPGAAVEVGCNQGWTTCFLVEALLEQGVKRDYVCIDTFTGFTREDVAVEYKHRGKTVGSYENDFLINDPEWLKASVKRFGYSNVSVHKADATTFDYQALGKIAFALVDVDLYRPVGESLKRIIPHMAKGGVVVVDDCDDGEDRRWDGAYQAFTEFCKERNIPPEIVNRKLGIIHT